ncbi:MAG: S8 family serine peptidase [Desulfurococcales archaeon]|nr:S8 family serine peptidase [Desulfurococcales archaeon]
MGYVFAVLMIAVFLAAPVASSFTPQFSHNNLAYNSLTLMMSFSKIDPAVLQDLLDDGKATFMVIMTNAPSGYASNNPFSIASYLREYASYYQAQTVPLVLATGGKVLRQFWIENAELVEGSLLTALALAKLPFVKAIVPNFEVHALDLGRGPQPLVALDDVAPQSVSSWGIYKIKAPDVWSQYGDRGQGIRVAVLDTGVDISHPALQGKMFTVNPSDSRYPGGWIEFDSNGNAKCSTPHDSGEHGTHVSGTVLGGDGQNIAIGVAPDAKLMHALVLPGGSGSFASVLAGIEWAVSPYDCNGNPTNAPAHVISMSLGASGYYGDYLLDAIKNALQANIVVVAAIGNEGQGTSSNPGNIWGVIGVGATDQNDNHASFSSGEVVNWNNPPSSWPFYGYYPSQYIKPDVSAPGVSITSSVPGGGYASWDGTSMATPHVAGTVALILSALGWTDWSVQDTPEKVYEALINTAVDLGQSGQDTEYGYGRIDAYEAVTYALNHYGGGGGGGGGGNEPQPQPGKIYGYVYSQATGQAIAGAVVTVEGVGSTTTDSNGYYEITVNPGTYTVKAEADGYYSQTKNVTVGDGQQVKVDFALQPIPQNGEKVAVIGDTAGNIVQYLQQKGYTVVAYQSVTSFLSHADSDIKVVVVNYWDGSDHDKMPSKDELLQFLSYIDSHNIGLVALDGAYEGKGTMGYILYHYNKAVEQAGYAAPDSRDYGYTYDTYVAVYVVDSSHPIYNGIDGHYYLVDTSNSQYADYVYVDFNDDSGVQVLGKIAVYTWWGWTIKGATIAVYDAPGPENWVFLFSGLDGYWLQYLQPGADGEYSQQSHLVLSNAIEVASP